MRQGRRRLIIALIEGPTDNKTLLLPMKRLLPIVDIEHVFTDGDLCMKDGASIEKVQAELENKVQHFFAQNAFRRGQSAEVIHIIDLDDAFFPQVSDRLRRKAEIVRELSQQHAIVVDPNMGTQLPYSLYYMSKNLEHVIHGERGPLSSSDKDQLALSFQRKVSRDSSILLNVLKQSAAPGKSAEETWEYADHAGRHQNKEPLNNLMLLFPRYRNLDDISRGQ